MSRQRTLSVAGRLAILLCGLAAVSTGVALLLQDRALYQDLQLDARDRLQASATSANRLIADHLSSLVTRYAAISRTPELRANLGARHAPTLSFYATRLLQDQGATLIGFLDADGVSLASAGDPRLLQPAQRGALGVGRGSGACVRPDRGREAGNAVPGTRRTERWTTCEFPRSGAQGSLLESRGELYALIAVPLRTGQRYEGAFLAVEPVGEGLLTRWSELTGATLHLGPADPAGEDLDQPVLTIPGLDVRVSTNLDAARAAVRNARSNIVASGVLAIFLALGASLFIARWFARPIVEIREATTRLSKGDLESRVQVGRGDEIGQLGEAFNELATRLTDSQERVRRAQRLAQFGDWHFDFEAGSFDGTEEFRRLFGLEGGGAIPLAVLVDRVRPADRVRLEQAIQQGRDHSAPFRLDVRVRASDGVDRILQMRGHARNRTTTRIAGSVQDVTDRRKAEEQIRYLSRHDSLTGLGNRERALEELQQRTRGRESEETFALLVIGIDDLQSVTDTFGHGVSDRLLVEVARRLVTNLRRGMREGPDGADLVARLGDERFVAILEGARTPEGATGAAERLLASVRGAYRVGADEISLITSAGVALWPADGDEAATLLRNAETALTRVQRTQPGTTRFFHESMHVDASRRIQIASRLRRALEEGALELYYQPRVRPETGELVGFEGLARWTDAELGSVSPGEFIPIAETTGSIRPLGTWAIETAAQQLRRWHESGHQDLCVSVNLSHQQLEPKVVGQILAATEGLDPASFELEVTESALIEEGDAAIETLTALRAHGFRIALDDFGTGYSSLSYLQGLPLDTVKVDRSFIRDIAIDPDAAALTGSVLAMCRALRLHTVVEGVETREQLAVLVELGYPEAQGFLFAKPMPAEEAEEYIQSAPLRTRRTSSEG